ncbi:hypothetical protein ALC56_08090, partial [Trachymyrmex septentrionalis]
LLASQILVFYGSTDDDADRWLRKVERAAAVHGVNDNVKLLAANGKLQKLARDWYDMEEESTDSWFTFKEVFIKRFRRQVSFTRVIQKAETCRWNSSKEDFLDYAARKIKLFQPLHLEQKSIINLLIGRIQDYAIKSAAAMIYIETVNEFLERMHQATNIFKVNCIEGKKCDLLALIDSGSPVSFIQRSVCKLLFGSDFPYNAVTVQRTLNALQIKVIGQKDIGIRLAELSETSNRVTFNIIDTNNWSIHLILGTDFLFKNDLSLTLKKKAKDNLKLINEVASADIIKIDDFPIALSEIKTDFDPRIRTIVDHLEESEHDKFMLIEGLIYKKDDDKSRFYVPDCMITNILRVYYDNNAHCGVKKVIQGLRNDY